MMASEQNALPLWYQPLANYSRLLDMANAADPQTHPWGYFAWHHGFACSPLTLGAFMWFTSRDEMLQGLVQGELQLEFAGSVPQEEIAHLQAMREIADRVAAGNSDLQSSAITFSQPYDFLSIEWMGHFDDLLSSYHPFALELRKQFGQDSTSTANSDSVSERLPGITSNELPEFIAMLNEWGI